MAQDEYNLQVLLELRERELEEVEDRYAKALAELERRKQTLRELQQSLVDARKLRAEACQRFDDRKLEGGISMAQVSQFEDYRKGLLLDEQRIEQDIEDQRNRIRQQERTIKKVKQELIEATKGVKAVEKHKEAWEAEQAVLDRRKQSNDMDDIAARRWREQNNQ